MFNNREIKRKQKTMNCFKMNKRQDQTKKKYEIWDLIQP